MNNKIEYNSMKEVFKIIKEYPDYEVSNHGRIRYKNKITNKVS